MRRMTLASEERRISGSVNLRPLQEVLFLIQADAHAIGHAAATAGALVRRRLRDRLDLQLLDLVAVASSA